MNNNRKQQKRRRTKRRPKTLFQNMQRISAIPPRMNNVRLSAEILLNLANATVPVPYGYSFYVVTNPMICNQGSATSVPYFTMYTAAYRKFRVRNFSVTVNYVNTETHAVNSFVCPFNYLPPNTVASNQAALTNILCRKKLVSPAGGMDRATLRISQSVSSMAGFANTNVEDAYVGLTDGTSPPSDNIYVLVATQTNGLASVIGVLTSVLISFGIDFMERQTPLN